MARYKHGYAFSTDSYKYISEPGLNKQVIEEISTLKNEPEWMLQRRLKAYEVFKSKPMPSWGVDLSKIDFRKACTTLYVLTNCFTSSSISASFVSNCLDNFDTSFLFKFCILS